MPHKVSRRAFLESAPVAATLAAMSARARPVRADGRQQSTAVRIGSSTYRAGADYPIRSQAYTEVKLTDAFWRPKVAMNAEVTIPFEVAKRDAGDRGLGGGVFEAAILSLVTHPNAALQAQVDTRVRTLAQSPAAGNNGFEIAATYFRATGRRDLLD